MNLTSSSKIVGLFCKRAYKRDYILQKRPIILRSLLIWLHDVNTCMYLHDVWSLFLHDVWTLKCTFYKMWTFKELTFENFCLVGWHVPQKYVKSLRLLYLPHKMTIEVTIENVCQRCYHWWGGRGSGACVGADSEDFRFAEL